MQSTVYLIILGLLAGASYALLQWVDNTFRPPPEPDNTRPTLTITDCQVRRFGPNSTVVEMVASPLLQQWPGQAGTLVQQPVIHSYLPDGETVRWYLSAEQGWIAPDRQTLRLDGTVLLTRMPARGPFPSVIITRDVQWQRAQGVVETQAPTVIHTPEGQVQSRGVRAFLHEQRYEWLSDVQGTYAPPSHRPEHRQ